MKCNEKKLKYTCGTRTNARCVFYDLELPEISKLHILEDCVTLEETTEDTYKLLDVILTSIDMSELGEKCLDYPKTKNKYNPLKEDVYLVKDVLKVMEEKICLLLEEEEQEDIIKSLDFKCLVDPCGETIGDLKTLLQVLIDEICKLKEDNG